MQIDFGNITEKAKRKIIEEIKQGYTYGTFEEKFESMKEMMKQYKIDAETAIYMIDGIMLDKYVNKIIPL